MLALVAAEHVEALPSRTRFTKALQKSVKERDVNFEIKRIWHTLGDSARLLSVI